MKADSRSVLRKKIQRANWYVNRLRAMSVSELTYRISSKLVQVGERNKYKNYSASYSAFLFADRYLQDDIRRKSKVRFYFDIEQAEELRSLNQSAYSIESQANLARSQKLLDHTFVIFGEELELGVEINWSQDPLTKQVWPKTFWGDINLRSSEEIGGVKWVWELNRHYHLVALGKAYLTTSDEKYAEEVCAQLESWILENPPLLGVNWTSSLELAIRLINWAWVLSFLTKSPSLTRYRFEVIIGSIIEQTSYISRHLSAYSSANNHLIGEAAGLAVVGMVFPWLTNADVWRQKGFFILEAELKKQIYPDGVPAEHAISYLNFVLNLNLMVWRLAKLNRFDVPDIWKERLCSGCDFIKQIFNVNGYVPEFGDSDDGIVVRLDDSDRYNKYRSILVAGAIMCDRPDFKRAAGSWDETNHWLFGEEGRLKYKNLPDIGLEDRSRSFPIGGYSSMKSNGNALLFDHGPLGYLSTAAHGHADALSLWLSVDNNPVLVDAGTYAYQEGGKWRDFFRGTSAHNTIRVEMKDQSEIRGTFLWGKKAKAQLLSWESNQDYDLAIAEHDGYKQLGIVHRRAILYIKPDVVVIEDSLIGSGSFKIEQFWHFSESCKLTVETDFVSVDLNQNNYYIVQEQNAESLELNIIQGQESPPQGWISKNYGTLLPAPVLCLSGTVNFPTRITVGFYLNNSIHKKEISSFMTHAFGRLNEIRKG